MQRAKPRMIRGLAVVIYRCKGIDVMYWRGKYYKTGKWKKKASVFTEVFQEWVEIIMGDLDYLSQGEPM